MVFRQSKMAFMNTTVTVDKAGRIVIPKQVRDQLRLESGDSIALESDGECVTLRPLHASTPLQKERGVWVFRGSKPLSLEAANRLIRNTPERRADQNPDERQ
jgi:AbrB family looped-hinge helix DNA binding protein